MIQPSRRVTLAEPKKASASAVKCRVDAPNELHLRDEEKYLIAVYPGSFDPITSGHMDIIERSAALYQEVVVLVAVNSSKKPAFTLQQRVDMIQRSVEAAGLSNVRIQSFSVGLLVDYADQIGAGVIVKGLRAVSDFEYEFQMALLNRRLKPNIETVFLMTGAEYSYLSSSIVKEIARLGGEIRGLVPEVLVDTVRERFDGEQATAGAQLVERA
ncbi:MAG TPA: pantetheine-phosphate adenylyltransferase [Capsulimonadaceae bacterium]|jgi:pantetheine-phosphate adenylyltransferase